MSEIILYAILSTPDDIYTFLLSNVAASCYLHAILIYSIHAFWSAFVFLAVLFSSVRKFLGQFYHRFERGGWRYSANHGHLIGAYRWELCRSLATTCHAMIDAKIMAQLTLSFVTVFLINSVNCTLWNWIFILTANKLLTWAGSLLHNFKQFLVKATTLSRPRLLFSSNRETLKLSC